MEHYNYDTGPVPSFTRMSTGEWYQKDAITKISLYYLPVGVRGALEIAVYTGI